MRSTERVIVIGASAGGVQALRLITEQLPDDLAAPVLMVLHIGAHPSQLPDLLNWRRPRRAVFAESGQVPEAGRIYVAPSDRHLLIEDGVLRVTSGPKEHHSRPAIDPLFRSAALDLGRRAIGVILTGMLDDGSAGLHAIKLCGGTTVVQDPALSDEPSMPRSALAVSPADHVVGLDAMAALLVKLAAPLDRPAPVVAPEWLRVEHEISLGRQTMESLRTIGSPSGFTCPDCGGALFELGQGEPLRFLCHTGHAFSLRSLASAQDAVTDIALWAGLRAVQEKEAILRRLVESRPDESTAAQRQEAESLARFITTMRGVIEGAPTATPDTPAGPPAPDDPSEPGMDAAIARSS